MQVPLSTQDLRHLRKSRTQRVRPLGRCSSPACRLRYRSQFMRLLDKVRLSSQASHRHFSSRTDRRLQQVVSSLPDSLHPLHQDSSSRREPALSSSADRRRLLRSLTSCLPQQETLDSLELRRLSVRGSRTVPEPALYNLVDLLRQQSSTSALHHPSEAYSSQARLLRYFGASFHSPARAVSSLAATLRHSLSARPLHRAQEALFLKGLRRLLKSTTLSLLASDRLSSTDSLPRLADSRPSHPAPEVSYSTDLRHLSVKVRRPRLRPAQSPSADLRRLLRSTFAFPCLRRERWSLQDAFPRSTTRDCFAVFEELTKPSVRQVELLTPSERRAEHLTDLCRLAVRVTRLSEVYRDELSA